MSTPSVVDVDGVRRKLMAAGFERATVFVDGRLQVSDIALAMRDAAAAGCAQVDLVTFEPSSDLDHVVGLAGRIAEGRSGRTTSPGRCMTSRTVARG